LVSLVVCLLLLCLCEPLVGRQRPKPQEYALIFGTVWGPDDLPVPGIRVNIRRTQDKKARWELYSNARGEFEQRVPAGPADYVIWADTKGYKLPNGKRLQPSPDVTLHVDNTERADTGLHLK
jgi:hypothetical protein